MRIRRAQREECATLTRVAHAAKAHWGYPDEHLRLWASDLTVDAGDLDAQRIFCAVAGEEIVGFYGLSDEDGAWELEHCWVAPARMGRGVGRALFEHAATVLRAAGARELRIASDPHAEGFYLRMGARRIGDVPSTPAGRRLPLLVWPVA